jgi:hypothetical protein
MDWAYIAKNWPNFQSSARLKWSALDEAEICRIGGDRLDLISRIQKAYAVSRVEAEQQVTDWLLINSSPRPHDLTQLSHAGLCGSHDEPDSGIRA